MQNAWERHRLVCVEDPRSGLPNAEKLGVRDLIKADHDHFVATNNGKTDIKRYKKVLFSNLINLKVRLGHLEQYTLYVRSPQLDTQLMAREMVNVIREESMQPEEIARRALSSARLSSLKNDITVDQLIDRAHKSLQHKHYVSALRNFNFSIDKLLLEKPIVQMLKKEQIRFAKLYCKRAECNLELAEKNRSEKNADNILNDYAFVMQIGVFNKEYIDSDVELCEKFRHFKTKATKLKDGFTRRRDNQQRQSPRQQQRTFPRYKAEEKASELSEDSTQAVDAYLCSQLGEKA